MTWLLLTFAREGAARYLSHLDTARALLRTFARAEVGLALSQGMRPKPRLSLGLPLPVGAAARRELAAAELAPDEARAEAALLEALRAAAPEGIVPLAVELTPQRVRLEPRAAVYECAVGIGAERARAAAEAYATALSLVVERGGPKGPRQIDLKRYVAGVDVLPGAEREGGVRLRFVVRHRSDGAARPEEVAAAFARLAGAPGRLGSCDAESVVESAGGRDGVTVAAHARSGADAQSTTAPEAWTDASAEVSAEAGMHDLVRLEVEYERRPSAPSTEMSDGRRKAAAAQEWGAAAGERGAGESDGRLANPAVKESEQT